MSEGSVPKAHRARAIAEFALLAALVIGVLYAYLCIPLLPSNDGPRHTLGAWIRDHLEDPSTGWSTFFRGGMPISSQGFTLPFRVLAHGLPWRLAHQLTVALAAVGCALGYVTLARSLARPRAAVGLLGFVWAAPWFVYMGFFAFLTGTAIGLFVLAVALAGERTPWSWRRTLAIAGLFTAQCVAHAFSAALTALVLCVILAFRTELRSKSLWKNWALRLGVALLPVVLFTLRMRVAMTGFEARSSTEVTTLPWDDRFALLLEGFVGGPAWRKGGVFVLAVVGVGASVVHRLRRGRFRFADEPGVLAAGLLCLVLALVVPLHLRAWSFFSPRFIAPAMVLLVLLVPLGERPALRRALIAAFVAFAAASLVWTASYHQRLFSKCSSMLAGIDAPVKRHGPRLSLPIDSSRDCRKSGWPFVDPIGALASYYPIEQGGFMQDGYFASPEIHEVYEREGVEFPPAPSTDGLAALANETLSASARPQLLTFLATAGTLYEDVVVAALPADRDAIFARGYRVDWSRDRVSIAHFEGCPLEVAIEGEHALARLETGFLPGSYAMAMREIGSAESSVRVERGPCGAAWIRVRDALGRVCLGVDDKGRIRLDDAARSAPVRCTLTDPKPKAP